MKEQPRTTRFGAIAISLVVAASLVFAAATAAPQSPKATPPAKNEGSESASPARAGGTRIAFVDIERISTEAKFVRDMLGDMEKSIEGKRAAIDKKQKDYEKLRDDLTRKRDVLTQSEYDSTLKESRRLRTELEDDDYELNKIMDKYHKEDLAPALDKILKAVQEVAKREGVDIVLRGEMVVHGDPAVDLSDRVIEYLNADYKPGTKTTGSKDTSAKETPKEAKSTPKETKSAKDTPTKDTKRAPAVSSPE